LGINNLPQILQEFNVWKIFLVVDSSFPFLNIKERIEKLKIQKVVFSDFTPNPVYEDVCKGIDLLKAEKCDVILAVGGGSAIDVAKCIKLAVLAKEGNDAIIPPLVNTRIQLDGSLIPFIAIPTTAGTGSETTVTSVITDSKTHHKYLINDFSLIPHYAVLDYKVTLGLPPHITSTTGMDALTHAVEAFIGNTRTKETKKMSMEATKLIVSSLKTCYHEPTNAEARKNMLFASHYAGISFTKAYVGYVHAVAHTLGGKYGVPHGLANSVILPVMLEAYGSKAYKKLAVLSRYSGLANENDSDEVAAKNFINWIKEANKEMNIPTYIEQIKEEDIDSMVETALKEGNPLYPVPVLMGKEEIKKIYLSIMKSE
jgi:alcohol dehydrogenase class IV